MSGVFHFFFDAAQIIGTVAFAASGAMLAIDRDLDLFGVLFLGVITAVGGGAIRDLLLGSFPPVAFRDATYVLVAFVTALIVFLLAAMGNVRYWRERDAMDRAFNLLDAIGLGIFSAVGAQTAMNFGFSGNAFLCVFMGMTTGVGGGVLRDLLSKTVPAVLKKRIYAVASIIGAATYYYLVRLKAGAPIAMLSGMLITVLIRLLATHYAWNLPRVKRPE